MTAAPPAAEGTHRGQLEKLARRGTASVVGAGFSAVFGVLLVVVVTNGFSPTVAGTLFAATSAFLILESLALLGTDTGLVRWLPTQIASGRAADLPRTLVVSAVPVLGLSLCLGGRPARRRAGAGAAPGRPGVRVHDDGHAAGARPGPARGRARTTWCMAATRGTGTMRPTVLVDNIGRLGLQAVAVLVVCLAGGGALALALAWSLPYVLGAGRGRRLVAPPGRAPDDGSRGPRHARGPSSPASSGPTPRRAPSPGSPRPR